LVSTLNDVTGTIVANAAIVPAGTSGSIDVYASNNTDIIIDINGYYAAAEPPITLAGLAGPWQMTLTGFTGCGTTTMLVTFTLDATGSGPTTTTGHTSGCGDAVSSGNPFSIQSLNPNGSGKAGLSCGTACGWGFDIQVAKNGQIFNVVDVDPLNPNNYLEGTAIHQ
jgi:hypothetical protein